MEISESRYKTSSYTEGLCSVYSIRPDYFIVATFSHKLLSHVLPDLFLHPRESEGCKISYCKKYIHRQIASHPGFKSTFHPCGNFSCYLSTTSVYHICANTWSHLSSTQDNFILSQLHPRTMFWLYSRAVLTLVPRTSSWLFPTTLHHYVREPYLVHSR